MVVTTRELKQNPAAAIRRVLDRGEPVAVTAHGRPTGVVMAPAESSKRAWVPGQALVAKVSVLEADAAAAWADDLAAGRQEFGRDPWGDAA